MTCVKDRLLKQSCCYAAATRAELGPEAAAEVAHALRLLQERGDRHAAFWACPPCDAAFPSSTEFGEHLYTYHEVGPRRLCTRSYAEDVRRWFHNPEGNSQLWRCHVLRHHKVEWNARKRSEKLMPLGRRLCLRMTRPATI